jgi:shikimate kinase
VLVIGMMGSGKTTVGKRLAARLGVPFVDTDAEVVSRAGMTVPEIFADRGEAGFRAAESAVLADLAGRSAPTVIAVAGGAVLADSNREVLRAAGTIVWLRARPETIIGRIGDGRGRPLLQDDPAERIRTYDALRRPIYSALADLVVDVDGRGPRSVLEQCLRTLRAAGAVPSAESAAVPSTEPAAGPAAGPSAGPAVTESPVAESPPDRGNHPARPARRRR